MIFFSHCEKDKDVVDLLVSFLFSLGIATDRKHLFCTSIPGNGVNQQISTEILNALDAANLNLILLSRDYYQSAYCMNEAGIIWYKHLKDKMPLTIIALPEISPEDMQGFLTSDYMLHRLDSNDDISSIYESVTAVVASEKPDQYTLEQEKDKLRKAYTRLLEQQKASKSTTTPILDSKLKPLTDSEQVVLYYMLTKGKIKVTREEIQAWLPEQEAFNLDADTAFILLSKANQGVLAENTFELDTSTYRKLSAKKHLYLDEFGHTLNNHRASARHKFEKLWNAGKFDEVAQLFLSYIIEERKNTFFTGDYTRLELGYIKSWEDKNLLRPQLSEVRIYEKTLIFFFLEELLYAIDHNNPRHPGLFRLYKSLDELLFTCKEEENEICRQLRANKEASKSS